MEPPRRRDVGRLSYRRPLAVSSPRSDEAALGHRHRTLCRDHEVVEEPDVEERERVLEPVGQDLVRTARLGHPRRVVVKDDQCGGVMLERPLGHDAGIHLRRVDSAGEKLLACENPVLGVEEDRAEDLARPLRQPQAQVGSGDVGIRQRFTPLMAAGQDLKRPGDDAVSPRPQDLPTGRRRSSRHLRHHLAQDRADEILLRAVIGK